MAKLQKINGEITAALSEIQSILSPLFVSVQQWPTNQSVQTLLSSPQLNEEQKEVVTQAHDHYFSILQENEDYQSRDLIVLHPNIPKLDTLLEKFARIHTHDDNEVRYIVSGEGIFGFVLPNDEQVLLTVEAGEYINVPKDTEHWFVLTEQKSIKAIRYFTTKEGWTPNYTHRSIRF
jgi:1,2-dihydroxy-3-keto-5-methylthiopentene dioxygenase